ncbi:hypothetical protein AB7M56_004793 [Bradyrhizobium elkanii]
MAMKILDQRGAAAFEFCIVAMAIFALIFAIFDLGRYAIAMQSLRSLAGAGARAAMLDDCYASAALKTATSVTCSGDYLPDATKRALAPFLYAQQSHAYSEYGNRNLCGYSYGIAARVHHDVSNDMGLIVQQPERLHPDSTAELKEFASVGLLREHVKRESRKPGPSQLPAQTDPICPLPGRQRRQSRRAAGRQVPRVVRTGNIAEFSLALPQPCDGLSLQTMLATGDYLRVAFAAGGCPGGAQAVGFTPCPARQKWEFVGNYL